MISTLLCKGKLKVNRSLPVPLLVTPPAEQRFIHRLMYRTLPATVGEDRSHMHMALKFEIALGLSGTKPASSGDIAHDIELSRQNKNIDLAPLCWVGPETYLNLMIPNRFAWLTHQVRMADTSFHRSMDIRFSLFGHTSLSRDKWPPGLQTYLRDLQTLSVYFIFALKFIELCLACRKQGKELLNRKHR